MKPDETLQHHPESPLNRRQVELTIVGLLDQACARLKSPECKTHFELLAGFRDEIERGDTSRLEELNRWIAPAAIYQTPEDGYLWQASDLPEQLAQADGDVFVVSAWGADLVKLIGDHAAADE